MEDEVNTDMVANLLILGDAFGWRYSSQLGCDGLVNDDNKQAILFCETSGSVFVCMSGSYVSNRPVEPLPPEYVRHISEIAAYIRSIS